MRIATIDVPKGCTKIFVDVEDGCKVVVSYGSSINDKEFFCQETGEMEEKAGVGDFAIMWYNSRRHTAVVTNVDHYHGGRVIGTDGWVYDQAIKFRNYEQYLKVKGKYGEDEP